VAILIEALTDNRNRAAADLRAAFSKNGGNLGETGCVSWMFAQKGVVTIEGAIADEDALLEILLEAGADSYELIPDQGDDQSYWGAEVVTEMANVEFLTQSLKGQNYGVQGAELRWIPGNTVAVAEEDLVRSLLKLVDALEDLDDVQTVTTNFEISDELLATGIV
jgi:YebC/PmpR family DNA-binding regulatory protein